MTFDLTISAADLLLLLPEIFLTCWLCVVLIVDFASPRLPHTRLAVLSVIGLVATLACLAWFDVAHVSGSLFGNMFVLDRMAIFFKMFVVGSTALVILASMQYVDRFTLFRGEYYFLVMMSALGMMFMVSANDLLSLFVSIEFSTLGFYILVGYLREDLTSNEAGLKFFILGVFAAGLLAYGISLVYGETGKLVFSEMTPTNTTGTIIGFLLIFAALGFKIGAVPFHSWIPDTYHGAPTPVTAFLSIAPKGAAFAILIRLFFVAVASFKPMWVLLLVAVSILSMTYGNIVAIAQRNIKRLLAYSGIAQVGNVLIGLAAGTKMGSDAILFYLLTYLFANIGAFAVVIAVAHAIGSEEIDDYSGLNRRSPFLAFAMLLFLLSLAGVPPLAGFIGKLYIFIAAVKEGLYTLITVGLINIVISMYYYLVVVKKMYINEPTDPSPVNISGPMKAVVYIGLAGTLVIGIYPQPVIEWVVDATLMFSNMVGPSAVVTPSLPPFGG
ncbi:MAG: NADH-quinone oxidoreductase subunit N [Nitrospira sp.]|nr:NADH-quinone oxidoreductase subunit N [Nitrospira sp.]MCP9441852.1 NADH-quinone oxidoreductase subunit N [Nitrospira sp.]